jgi:RimJ/RimL family protein N-acetyltransferase
MKEQTYILDNKQVLYIQEAKVDQAFDILKFVHKVSTESDFLTFGSVEFDLNENQEKAHIQNQLNSENQIFLVATIESEIVAILNFSARNRPRIKHSGEFSMVVQKKYWNSGIGTLTLDTFLEWARSNQITKKINLRVRTDNKPAIHLYEKRGFIKEGTLRREILIDGVYYDLFWMGLEI